MQISEFLTYKFKDLESGITLWFLRGTHRPQMQRSCSNESLNVPVGVVFVIYTSREDRTGLRCVRNDAHCYQHWVSAKLRRGDKGQLSHIVLENIFVQTDLGTLFLCCVHMSLWMHAPSRVYKSVWGLDATQLERQMFVGPGCWDSNSGPCYWAAIALNLPAIPLALGLEF